MVKKDLGYHLRTILIMLIFAAIVVGMRIGVIPNTLRAGRIIFPLSDTFVMLGAGLIGYQYGLLMFLVIFFSEMFIQNTSFFSLFPLFLYLILALISGYITVRRWYRDGKRLVVASVVMELVLAVVFYLVIYVAFGAMFNESAQLVTQNADAAMNYNAEIFTMTPLTVLIGTTPEVVIAVLLLWLYFNHAPDRVKKSFGKGYLYTKDYDDSSALSDNVNDAVLSRRITALSMLEGFVFGLVQYLFAESELNLLTDGALPEGWNITTFRICAFFLGLTVSISIAVVVNEALIAMVVRMLRSQQRLETELRVAEARSDAKSSFLANMSHEIRTPINAVLGMNEMILRESGEDNILGYAESVRTSGNTLLGLVNDILDFSKIEAGKMDIIEVDYKLSSMLNDLSNMIQIRTKEKGLTFSVDVNPAIPDLLHGDEIRIKQVITNILTNAAKYTKEGGVKLNVDYSYVGEDIDLKVSVSDTGIGIKSEDIPKLFTAFDRIEEERNRSIEGTGLGMNITQKLLAMMDSHLEVQSVYGKGSTFSFSVRQKVAGSELIGDYEEAFRASVSARKKYHESFTAPSARVLVVDDTEMNLVVFKSLLKKTLVQIDTAQSGEECLLLTRQNRYDLIFLDHRMPDKDGIETLKEIRREKENKNTDTPVLCLTANAVSGAREEYIAAGFNDYLTKPINPDALESAMRAFLPADKLNISDKENDSKNDRDKKAEEKKLKDEALEIYLKNLDMQRSDIESFFEKEDWINYTIKVHALKSSSRIVGEEEIAEFSARLEKAGDAGDISFIRENNDRLINLLYALKDKYNYKYAEEATNEESEELPEIAPSELSDALEAIEAYTQIFDYDSLIIIMKQLKNYRIPDDKKELIRKISAAADRADWTALKQAIDVSKAKEREN